MLSTVADGRLFDLKLWIGDMYFGTKPIDSISQLMHTVKDLEELQKSAPSKLAFEIYILTPDPMWHNYKDQEQTDNVAYCIEGNDDTSYNHFINYVCANTELVRRDEILDFFKKHGIKNMDLIKERNLAHSARAIED